MSNLVEELIKHDYIDEFDMESSIKVLGKFFDKISSQFNDYEERKSQKNMIMFILKSYEQNKHLLVEAPTGTGKSLAYLLAFLSIWENYPEKEKPVLLVNTKTISLQEQLIEKDIPYLSNVLGLDINAKIVKGKGNYLCKDKVKNLMSAGMFNRDFKGFDSATESIEFRKLIQMITHNNQEIKYGSKSDIPAVVSNSLWNKMCCDTDSCKRKECKYYNDCFYRQAKKQLKLADILVCNHSLFFADLAVKMETDFEIEELVIPQFDFNVFDEAHHIEEIATDFLTEDLSTLAFSRLCKGLKKETLQNSLGNFFSNHLDKQSELIEMINQLEINTHLMFQDIMIFMGNDKVKRLKQENINFVETSLVSKSCEETEQFMLNLLSEFPVEIEEEVANSILTFVKRIRKIKTKLHRLIGQELEAEEDARTYWIEMPNKDTLSPFIQLQSAPLTVSNLLKENLFGRNNSIILTSATMGTKDMSYLSSRIGIQDYSTAMLNSPFDYKNQARIYIPNNPINPKANNYENQLKSEIGNLLQASKGRALVLFTSYKLLNSQSEYFKPFVEKMGYTFLKQGDLNRTELLDTFRNDVNSVLFATTSYWEGIDVKGESLSCVIITKLPFEMPDRPLIEARIEYLESLGYNSFQHYQIPMAVMRFKQGFGRLIRSSSDKGVVAILDNRILTMNYGKDFLQCLPAVPITRQIQELLPILN